MNQTTSALAEYSCKLERLYRKTVLKKLRMLDLVCNAPTVQARGNDLTPESYHELMRTSREEAERVLKENLLHCTAEAALGGHDLGEWQETTGTGIVGYQAKCRLCRKTSYASRLAVYSLLADVCPGDAESISNN